MKYCYNRIIWFKKAVFLMSVTFCLLLYPLFAETLTYIVRVSSFPDSVIKVDLPLKARQAGYEYLIDKGKSKQNLDFYNTRLLAVVNTNFMILEVTPSTTTDRTLLNKLVSNRHIQLISSASIATDFDSRRGSYDTRVNRVNFALPDDFIVKGVAKSTP